MIKFEDCNKASRFGIDLATDEYLRKRCLGIWAAESLGVFSYEKYICFPYSDDNIVYRYKLRDIHDKKNQQMSSWNEILPEENQKLPFFNQRNFTNKDYVIITEGEFDCLALNQIGYDNVISLPNGAQSVRSSFETNYKYLQQFKKIYFCFDMDESGENAFKVAKSLISPSRWLKICLKSKDANDGLINDENFKSNFKRAFDNAFYEKRDNVVRLLDLQHLINEKAPGGYRTEIVDLDKLMHGVRLHELTVITGDTGSGKTSFACQMVYNLSQKTKVYLNTYEMMPRRIVQKLGSILLENSTHGNDLDNYEKMKWSDFASRENIFLSPQVGMYKTQELLDDIEYAHYVHKCEIILVDHLSYLISDEEKESERKEIDYIVEQLFNISRKLPIHIFLVAHMKGTMDDKGELQMWKIKGSSNIKQVADNIIGVQRLERENDNDKGKICIKVLKNREYGLEGSFYLLYDPKTEKYTKFVKGLTC